MEEIVGNTSLAVLKRVSPQKKAMIVRHILRIRTYFSSLPRNPIVFYWALLRQKWLTFER